MSFGQWTGFTSLIISLYVLWQIRQLLLLGFTAIIFVIAFNRIAHWWQKFGLRRNLAISTTLIFTLVIVVLFFWLIAPPFVEQFQKLISLSPQVWNRIRETFLWLREKELQFDWLPPLPSQADLIQQLSPLGTQLFKNFFAFFSNSLTGVLQILFILVLGIMILVNPQPYRQNFIKLFPSFYRRRADEILTLTEDSLVNWLMGISINCLFIGTLSGIGLWILQVKLVLVHAILAGVLNFIPNIGPAASVIFPIMMALLDSPWKIVAIIILYVIIQNVESYWLTPIVMSKQVSLLPAITLVAQIFFAQLFGFFGLLLALPLTVIAKVWLEELLLKDILDKWQSSPNKSVSNEYENYDQADFPSNI